MKVHWFQHVPFEGLGLIEPWLRAGGHEITATHWWAGERAPARRDYDWLIVMGGPMNIYQHRDYPWLATEKASLETACREGCRVLGVCLGAQLLADVLGGRVLKNAEREIGWWPIQAVSPERGAQASRYAFPEQTTVLHWHGDTYTLPPDAVRLARSEACPQQAFAWGSRVLGLQFHLEMQESAVSEIARGCANELQGGARWVQSATELIRGAQTHGAANASLLEKLLAAMEAA